MDTPVVTGGIGALIGSLLPLIFRYTYRILKDRSAADREVSLTKIAESRDDKTWLRDRIDELESQIEKLRERIDKLEHENLVSARELAEKEFQLKTVRNIMQESEDMRADLERDNAALRQQLTQAMDRLAKFELRGKAAGA